MAQFKALPPLEELQAAFDYDSETGIISCVKRNRGKEAGTLMKSGYRRIELNRQLFMSHRIAWALHYGEDPGEMQIDHIDGNKQNNAIDNLRLATQSQNQANIKAKGFFRQANGNYTAQVRLNGKLKALGTFATKEEAHAAYVQACLSERGEYVPVDYLEYQTPL